jgi:hypothetical protein
MELTCALAGRLRAGVSRVLELIDGDGAAPADADGAASRGLERHGVARCLEQGRRRSCRFGGGTLAGSADKKEELNEPVLWWHMQYYVIWWKGKTVQKKR